MFPIYRPGSAITATASKIPTGKRDTEKNMFLEMCTGCISNRPAGLSWSLSLFRGKVTRIKTITVNSGWWDSGQWRQSYQHSVKLTIASDLARAALSLLVVRACDWNRAVCTLSGHSCPSLTKTVLAGRDSFYSENSFTLLLACTELAQCLESRTLSLSLSLSSAKQAWQWHSNRNAWQVNRAQRPVSLW